MGGGGGYEPRETAAMRAQAEVGIDFFNLGKKTLDPALDLYELRMEQQFSDESYARAEGTVASAASKQIAELTAEQDKQLTSRGVDPTAGQFDSPTLQAAFEKGMAKTRAGARADQSDIAEGNVSNFIAMGLGQAADVAQGTAELASRSQQRAMREFGRERESIFGRQQMAGYLGGIGYETGAYGRSKSPYETNTGLYGSGKKMGKGPWST